MLHSDIKNSYYGGARKFWLVTPKIISHSVMAPGVGVHEPGLRTTDVVPLMLCLCQMFFVPADREETPAICQTNVHLEDLEFIP